MEGLPFSEAGPTIVIRLLLTTSDNAAQFSKMKDLTIEADYIARKERSSLLINHIEKALEKQLYRIVCTSYIQETIQSKKSSSMWMERELINGLSFELSDYSFGKPGRITCTKAISEEGILSVERESRLTGNIYDKATMSSRAF